MSIRAQSMLFTIYGDYVRHRGGEIWVGSLTRLMRELGFSEQATRSALSRMCQRGWLRRSKRNKKSYYSLTPKTVTLLEEGDQRIFLFQRRAERWDGQWHLVTYSIPEQRRSVRERFRKELGWLGYGALGYGTWISPHNSLPEVRRIVSELGIDSHVELFSGRHEGFSSAREMVARCWDLEAINSRYAMFINKYAPKYEEFKQQLENGNSIPANKCFVERTLLIHDYRKFPFIDPELPREFLPEDWLGNKATELFNSLHELLADKANAFFDAVYHGLSDEL